MSKEKLGKKLQSDPKFIPFNNGFDYQFVKTYIQNNKEEIKDINLIIKALSTVFFNQYFIELKDNFNKVIEQKSLAKDYTIQEKLIYPILHFSGLCTMNGRIIQ